MKTLRWLLGVTKLDKICNGCVRGKLSVRDIAFRLRKEQNVLVCTLKHRPLNYIEIKAQKIGQAEIDLRIWSTKHLSTCKLKIMRCITNWKSEKQTPLPSGSNNCTEERKRETHCDINQKQSNARNYIL
ncbi:unnamed protein product [Parnassius apollo]|uniref:(apollo) hypothetical protein n=1 Tax=Parnassius apollo TaxID=110799 RepID=A0A8S3YBI8_PARAO|nr:unnamed protein product [Parnassius apollo]